MPLKVHNDELPTVNLTSMIDVVFLLIIFFMVGTRFTESESSLTLDLPRQQDGQSSPPSRDAKTVTMYRDGTIEMDRKSYSLVELTRTLQSLRKQNDKLAVLLKCDEGSTFQKVVQLRSAVRKSGVTRVAFAATESTMASVPR
jgi:biopolymer transport protein ExbD